MFNKEQTEKTLIDKEIDSVHEQMQSFAADDEQYSEMLNRLERLHKLQIAEKANKKTVSPDAIVSASASIIGIAMILGFEKANIITSKAMSFVFKPKP